jgi:hypothetical protein
MFELLQHNIPAHNFCDVDLHNAVTSGLRLLEALLMWLEKDLCGEVVLLDR